jgi:hypothetical protein
MAARQPGMQRAPGRVLRLLGHGWPGRVQVAAMIAARRAVYTCAFHCGHRKFFSSEPPAPIAWCFLCQTYVGLIVLRNAEP